MSITKEITVKCLHDNDIYKGVGLSCQMHQISEMNILQELVDCK